MGAAAGAILSQVLILFTENRFLAVSPTGWILIVIGSVAGALIGVGIIALAIIRIR